MNGNQTPGTPMRECAACTTLLDKRCGSTSPWKKQSSSRPWQRARERWPLTLSRGTFTEFQPYGALGPAHRMSGSVKQKLTSDLPTPLEIADDLMGMGQQVNHGGWNDRMTQREPYHGDSLPKAAKGGQTSKSVVCATCLEGISKL